MRDISQGDKVLASRGWHFFLLFPKMRVAFYVYIGKAAYVQNYHIYFCCRVPGQ